MIVLLSLAGIIFIFLVIFLPVFFLVARKTGSSSHDGSGSGNVANPESPKGAVVSRLTCSEFNKA